MNPLIGRLSGLSQGSTAMPQQTRRAWIKGLLISSTGASMLMPGNLLQAAISHGFRLDLTVWKLGIHGSQDEAIKWASQHGFESVGAHTLEIARWSDGDFEATAQRLQEASLVWGTSNMPVAFRGDEEAFKDGMAKLPATAAALARAGLKSCITYIMPCHDSLTYLENFKLHRQRLGEIAKVLADHGLALGMEYVGTQSLRNRRRFPFIHTLRESLELIHAMAIPQVGLVLDSWHWHNAGDTAQDLRLLKPSQVISVELNDAQTDVAREDLQDGSRELPVATGVIDTGRFLNTLAAMGVKAPLMAEPFNQPFRNMPREQGIKTLRQALGKAVGLIEG